MAGRKSKKVPESVYSVAELAQNSEKLFGTNIRSEMVIAACKVNRVEMSTISNVRKLVTAFLNKEVN